MNQLERIVDRLEKAADLFPTYRPKTTIWRDEDSEVSDGPYTDTNNKEAFLELESIANDIIQEMRALEVTQANGSRKFTEEFKEGPRYNNSGRLVHRIAQMEVKKPEEYQTVLIDGFLTGTGKCFRVSPIDNVFLLILKLVLDSIEGVSPNEVGRKTKKRKPCSDSIACGRYVKNEIRKAEQNGESPKPRKKLVVEWSDKNGASAESMDKKLQDNPHLWKDDSDGPDVSADKTENFPNDSG